VVCPDLRGYGQSTLPPDAPEHAQSSKRAMAGDVVALMRHLGHNRFSVVGHDRGALVAFRTAMDHPEAVQRLVVMDGLPVIEHLERLNEAFALTWWHWWFLSQTDKPAEAFISADRGRWYRTPPPAEMGAGNHADVCAAFCDPAVVHGMCENYRAGLRVDRAHEEADRAAGRKIRCPMLLLVSTEDDLDIHGDPEGDLAAVDGRRVAQPPHPLRASPGRTGAGRTRRGAPGLPRTFRFSPGRLTPASKGPSLREYRRPVGFSQKAADGSGPGGRLAVPGSGAPRAAGAGRRIPSSPASARQQGVPASRHDGSGERSSA